MIHKNKSFDRWCATLKFGDLIFAFNMSSRKYSHIIRYRSHKTVETSRDGTESVSLVSGRALCGVQGNGWFWSVSSNDHSIPDEDDCPRCHSLVNSEGSKPRNFPKEIAAGTKETEPLSFGWKSFVPTESKRTVKWNYDKDIFTFKEVKVYRRGSRTVKIGSITAHTGPEDRSWPLLVATRWDREEHKCVYMCSTIEQALKKSFELMAQGGY